MVSSDTSCLLDDHWELTNLSGLLTVQSDLAELLENSSGSSALWVKTEVSHLTLSVVSVVYYRIYKSHIDIFYLVIHFKPQLFNYFTFLK